LDIYKSFIFVAALIFDFEKYLKARRRYHPDWTEKELRNPRHWQNHLRAELRRNVDMTLNKPKLFGYAAEYNSEAMGVNVHLTCQNIGLLLEWPPQQQMGRIALLAKPLDSQGT
jgi:hypothetical protein